jgi:hypothetical protein
VNSDWSDVWKGIFRLSFWNIGLGCFIRLFVALVNVQTIRNFRLLRMNRRTDGGEPGRMCGAWVLGDFLPETVVHFVTRRSSHFRRLEPHVVPA